jgi:hypothetical protein
MSRIGEIRPSQLLWTYGPGALIDLPNMSVVTLSTDRWPRAHCPPVNESRLLSSVQSILGPSVQELLMPPLVDIDNDKPNNPLAYIGVPVRTFPRWMRCVKCQLLSPCDTGLFKLKENNFRPEQTQYVHANCRGSRNDRPPRDANAVPARFLMACRAGHLDDFPWHWFVHNGPSGCTGTLRFYESGASLQTENLWVRCDQCGRSRNLSQAFGRAGANSLPACRGRHPHLDDFEDCEEEPRGILLGASNGWFPVTLSVLAIPMTGEPLEQMIADGWVEFGEIEDKSELIGAVKVLRRSGRFPGIDSYEIDKIWEAIEAHRSGGKVEQRDLKQPEWEVLTEKEPPKDYPFFMSKKTTVPKGFEDTIARVLLLERLREVNALLGFTRVEAPEEGRGDDAAPRAPLSRGAPEFVPATQVHGEGIFIQFDRDRLETWARSESVVARDKVLLRGHRGWRHKRKLDPDEGYVGVRYVLLHTFAHTLIRELALQCGYSAASIRERIYADVENGNDQAGVLIYTAAADSDGTLGGLVELGKPDNLGHILSQALDRARICASDPLCAEHDPTKDQTLHGAACHACSLVSETSCEIGNRYLDRALLVQTLEIADAAFFHKL